MRVALISVTGEEVTTTLIEEGGSAHVRRAVFHASSWSVSFFPIFHPRSLQPVPPNLSTILHCGTFPLSLPLPRAEAKKSTHVSAATTG